MVAPDCESGDRRRCPRGAIPGNPGNFRHLPSGPVFHRRRERWKGFRPTDTELARWALEDWQRSSGRAIRFEAAAESSALVRLYWAEPSEGQYGEMKRIVVDGRLGAAVYIRPDMTSLGPDIAERAARDPLLRESIVYLTCVHELGHALGLSHTRDYRDIMYFFGYGGDIPKYFDRYRAQLRSRPDIAKVSGLSSGDVTTLKALYGLP